MSISIRIRHMHSFNSALQDRKQVLEVGLCAIMFFILVDYGIDFKKPYPQWAITYFDEPLVRFTSYVLIYSIASWSTSVSLMLCLCILFLHIDHINLARKAIFLS